MITSISNDKIKFMEKLRKSASFRRENGLYIVEGMRRVKEIPKGRINSIYYTERAFERYREKFEVLLDMYKDICEEVSESCMNKMSDTETPQGIIASVKMKHYSLEDIIRDKKAEEKGEKVPKPFILVLERLQDPGNLGTIIRSAEATGVTGIVVSGDSADIYNPKVIRSTMGAIFRVKIYISDEIIHDIAAIKKNGIKVYAMHLDGAEFYNKDFTAPSAFLIGNEGNGLSPEAGREADDMIRIPMMGKVESLNAAISASVVSYEVLRQRIKK